MIFKRKFSLNKTKDLIVGFELFRTNKTRKDVNESSVKFFCIGANKTGTTSLKKAFLDLGFCVGNQRAAELMMRDVFEEDFEPLITYCKTAQVFQDAPFSYNDYYKILDKAFPNSKFILSIRDSDEQWFNSFVKFHSKIFGNGLVPTWEVLKKIRYVYRGWIYEARINGYNVTEQDDPYDKSKLTQHYNRRNESILEYFKTRPNDLLVINLSEENAFQKFCDFIDVKSNKTVFPWENKTASIQTL